MTLVKYYDRETNQYLTSEDMFSYELNQYIDTARENGYDSLEEFFKEAYLKPAIEFFEPDEIFYMTDEEKARIITNCKIDMYADLREDFMEECGERFVKVVREGD